MKDDFPSTFQSFSHIFSLFKFLSRNQLSVICLIFYLNSPALNAARGRAEYV